MNFVVLKRSDYDNPIFNTSQNWFRFPDS